MKNNICSLIFPKFDISWWGLMAPLGGLVMVKRGRGGTLFFVNIFSTEPCAFLFPFHLISFSNSCFLTFFWFLIFSLLFALLCTFFKGASWFLQVPFLYWIFGSESKTEGFDPYSPYPTSPYLNRSAIQYLAMQAHPLAPFNPLGLPLDPLGPCRPTPWPPRTL